MSIGIADVFSFVVAVGEGVEEAGVGVLKLAVQANTGGHCDGKQNGGEERHDSGKPKFIHLC